MRDISLFELDCLGFLALVLFFNFSNIGTTFQEAVLIGFIVILYGVWEIVTELKTDDYL